MLFDGKKFNFTLHTHEVTGSSPVVSTKKTTPSGVVFLFGGEEAEGREPI